LLSSPLAHPPVYFTHVVTPNRLDFGVWVSPTEGKGLVLGTNLNYFAVNVKLSEVFSGSAANALAFAGSADIWYWTGVAGCTVRSSRLVRCSLAHGSLGDASTPNVSSS